MVSYKKNNLKNLIFLLLIIFSFKLYAQSIDDLLNMRLTELNAEQMRQIYESGLIARTDNVLMSTLLLEMINNNVKADSLTCGQFLDSLAAFKQRRDDELAKTVNFGTDSIFIRGPYGEKNFAGLGELSLEKIVVRESKNLPEKYSNENLNREFGDIMNDATEISKIIANLELDATTTLLFGNSIFILSENGEDLSHYKIGDLLEIANKVKDSKEFRPIIDKLFQE